MIEIEKPRIERVESGESYGKFVVEPLEHGFGQTLGNSLRRILLSSLPGVAVSSIRIEGIQHVDRLWERLLRLNYPETLIQDIFYTKHYPFKVTLALATLPPSGGASFATVHSICSI